MLKSGASALKKLKIYQGNVYKNNDNDYNDKKIENVTISKEKIKDAKGKIKEKVVEQVTYHNGVVKSRLVGLYKDGRLIYAGASKTKKAGKRRSA